MEAESVALGLDFVTMVCGAQIAAYKPPPPPDAGVLKVEGSKGSARGLLLPEFDIPDPPPTREALYR